LIANLESFVPYHLRTDCRLCGAQALEKVLQLTPTPPANAFRAEAELKTVQRCFPLDLYLCRACSHVQLADVINPTLLFENYVYVSNTAPSYVEHLRLYARYVTENYLRPHDQVLEFGSNDGTFLRFFQLGGHEVLGVDPAREIAQQAHASGVPTRVDFFGLRCAATLKAEGVRPNVILANHVYAHIDDLRGVTAGVAALLPAGGFFIFEVSYLLDVVEHMLFDTIYHEHVAYHSVTALLPFLAGFGIDIVEVQRTDHQGGSLRVFAQKRGGVGMRPVDASVGAFLAKEAAQGLALPATYQHYAQRIDDLKNRLVDELTERRQAGQKLAGFGAPAKATTLMYHFGMTQQLIDFIADDNPMKQGLYSPGLNIPVLPVEEIYRQRPDAVVMLAWNFSGPVMRQQHRYLDEGGTFIVPLPEFHVTQAAQA
jgi:SAM-dependent methyltransferase